MKNIIFNLNNFFFNLKVKNPALLSKIIIGFALANIIILLPDAHDLFSANGYIPSSINDQYIYQYDPLLHWVLNPLSNFGISNYYAFIGILSFYIISLFLAFSRFKTLSFSIIVWIIHLMLINSSFCFSYGADYFVTFSLFVNILLNLNFIKNENFKNPLNSLIVRMVQVQLCLVYFFAGFGKAIGVDWLDGNAMWYVLNSYSPEFIKNIMPSLIEFPFLFQGLCWSVIALELLYPILIFIPKLKKLTLFSAIFMHLGIMLFMGLYTFGMVMIMLNVIAFGYYLKPSIFLRNSNTQSKLVPI